MLYILIVPTVVVGVGYLVFNLVSRKAAGLYIETTPEANVYVNGDQLQNTPFESTFEPGEYDIRLEPIGTEAHVFESRIELVSGVRTVIRHNFSPNYSLASSVVLSFKKEAGSVTALAVVSEPSSAEVYLDGKFLGFTPLKSSNLTPGNHSLLVGKDKYLTESVDVDTKNGYVLTVTTKLSADASKQEQPVDEADEPAKQDTVVVLPTGTGFLRVREKPDINSPEVARISPGEEYKLITQDAGSGWHEIEYAGGKNGFVSSDFTEVQDNQ